MTVLCAKEGFEAHVTRDYLPPWPTETHMRQAPGGGSRIIENRAGKMSGTGGRLNPILDDDNRAYLYADNIAINDDQNQPVRFVLNKPVRLTDSFGARATLWFREILGTSCVFDYRYDCV